MELSKTIYKTKLDGDILTLDATLDNQLSNIINFQQLKFNDVIAQKLLEDESFLETLYVGAKNCNNRIEFNFTKWFSDNIELDSVNSYIHSKQQREKLAYHIIESIYNFFHIETIFSIGTAKFNENEVTLIMIIKEN